MCVVSEDVARILNEVLKVYGTFPLILAPSLFTEARRHHVPSQCHLRPFLEMHGVKIAVNHTCIKSLLYENHIYNGECLYRTQKLGI